MAAMLLYFTDDKYELKKRTYCVHIAWLLCLSPGSWRRTLYATLTPMGTTLRLWYYFWSGKWSESSSCRAGQDL